MQTIKKLLVAAIAIILFSCGYKSQNPNENYSTLTMDSTKIDADSSNMNEDISSSAAVENKKDNTHKFIRTADLKFKVKNVVKATYNIEDIITQQGGFVSYTNLSSNVDNTNTVQVSADSTLETTHFTVSNAMVIRVPNTQLDTTLKLIANYVDFLDSRIIKADDVTLQILSNNLAIKRYAQTGKRLTNDIDTKGKKLTGITDAEDKVSGRQENSDNSFVSNLSLAGQVKFSTITLSLYQRQSTRNELIANDKNINAYKPTLGRQLLEAFEYGWEILELLLVFITRFWALWLLCLAAYFLYQTYTHTRKARQ